MCAQLIYVSLFTISPCHPFNFCSIQQHHIPYFFSNMLDRSCFHFHSNYLIFFSWPRSDIESYDFSSSSVRMLELNHSEGWALKNWCFWAVVLEKTPESPLDSKEIKPVSPKKNQPWIFIGRIDAEAEAPILWPPDSNSWLTEKDADTGKGWRQKEKRVAADEMIGWYHRHSGHEFEQTLRDGEGQGSLACCSPWDHKELDMT